jgi:acetyl-CoA carboxylase biotin carboxyl carrier protein
MDTKELRDIFRLLERHDISDFTLEKGEVKLRVRRGEAGRGTAPHRMGPPSATAGEEYPATGRTAGAAHGGGGGAADAARPGREVVAGDNQFIVTSPIVGTFYRAPSPDAASYVEVGSRVSKGTVVAIIEAMKLMNEIECEVSGTVAAVLVENAQPVEYGAPLFLIDLV